MKNLIKIAIVMAGLFIVSCNSNKSEILSKDSENQDKLKILESKYNLKRIPLKNGKVSGENETKHYNSIEEFEEDLIKFKELEEKVKRENIEHLKFSEDVKKLGNNFTNKQFFELVDKYPVVKQQLILQNGGEEMFNIKVKEALRKEKK